MTEWVLTYSMDFKDTVKVGDIECEQSRTMEFFRGSRDECLRIANGFTCGEDDRRRTKNPWKVTIGMAKDWDEFLEDLD